MSNVTSLEYWNILDFKIFFVLVSGTVEDHKSMSNVTISEYWNILDFRRLFVLVSGSDEDLSGMSNVTCLEYFLLQNIFYTSQNLSRNSSANVQYYIFYVIDIIIWIEFNTTLFGSSCISNSKSHSYWFGRTPTLNRSKRNFRQRIGILCLRPAGMCIFLKTFLNIWIW